MLPVALVLMFMLELAYALMFGYFMFGDRMVQRLDELTICILLYLVFVRVALVLATFLLAHRLNTCQPTIARLARVQMLIKESAVTIFAFSILIPLSFVFAPRLKRSVPPTVVLMVHGFMSNSGVWWWLARRLRRQGVLGLDSLNLAPVLGDVSEYVTQLNLRVNELKGRGARSIVFIGHSMGGLVCRTWLQAHANGGHAADGTNFQLMTLCTPWHGTRIAQYLRIRSLAQLAHRNPWLNAQFATPDFPALALYSAHDNVVIPFTSAIDEDIQSIELCARGHLSVLFDRTVANTILGRVGAQGE